MSHRKAIIHTRGPLFRAAGVATAELQGPSQWQPCSDHLGAGVAHQKEFRAWAMTSANRGLKRGAGHLALSTVPTGALQHPHEHGAACTVTGCQPLRAGRLHEGPSCLSKSTVARCMNVTHQSDISFERAPWKEPVLTGCGHGAALMSLAQRRGPGRSTTTVRLCSRHVPSTRLPGTKIYPPHHEDLTTCMAVDHIVQL